MSEVKDDRRSSPLDLDRYRRSSRERSYRKNLKEISPRERRRMEAAGLDFSGKGRSGTFIQMDQSVVHAQSAQKGVEVLGVEEAGKKYSWFDDYFWKLVSAGQDEYTREVSQNAPRGYFLRTLAGVKTAFPLQSCLFLGKKNLLQSVHNIIIAEENSELNIITGCATASYVKEGLHLGISEIYVKSGARVTFTMIHNWAEEVAVRPRTVTMVEEGGTFISNYICLKPVKNLQMYPTAILKKGAVASFNSILFAHPGSSLDVGSRVILKGEGSRAEVVSRAVSNGGTIIARGYLRGEVKGIRAHLECRGLIISRKGKIHAIPELEALVSDLDMSHEAAVGKIAREEIEYLMARGLSEGEATSTIVRGFMDVSILGLPPALEKQVDQAISACEKEAF
ncbi:MAG: SufD family Fe-S cluster assembly protein [Candidatus Euphemobacter frigidus]|nr:SufD family Fe-S cluster assembly protein [Candidatus Euphemobacter frigidus]MDP8276656.1 SufD family Fe-S cluster assembly protein [Candidatus Euphemobacter frigidus]